MEREEEKLRLHHRESDEQVDDVTGEAEFSPMGFIPPPPPFPLGSSIVTSDTPGIYISVYDGESRAAEGADEESKTSVRSTTAVCDV